MARTGLWRVGDPSQPTFGPRAAASGPVADANPGIGVARRPIWAASGDQATRFGGSGVRDVLEIGLDVEHAAGVDLAGPDVLQEPGVGTGGRARSRP